MSKILENLSQEQRIPAEVINGPVLVTAGAGSGKTRMLTHRIAHMVFDENVAPYNILAITFTNKAANEMRERLEKMIGDSNDMWICTFHSMCSKILRRDIDKIGYTANFSIYTDIEKTRTVKRLLEPKNTNI
ncbi:MAG: UvrD-helicase domain-containing protein, partial [Clostridia bacterium]|nr:UvrD-helicase domain-containing protein [Clostridia bacterium]